MPVKVADWKTPRVKVFLAPEDSTVIGTMEFQKNQESGLLDLVVQFRNDTVYHYFDVEEEDIAQVLFSHSIGSAFNNLISKTDKYRFEKVI